MFPTDPCDRGYIYILISVTLFTCLLLMFLMHLWLQPVDKQSFLDSGIFCCLIHILNALLAPDGGSHLKKSSHSEDLSTFDENIDETRPARKLEVSPPFFLYFKLVQVLLRIGNMFIIILRVSLIFILRRSLLSGEIYSWIL